MVKTHVDQLNDAGRQPRKIQSAEIPQRMEKPDQSAKPTYKRGYES